MVNLTKEEIETRATAFALGHFTSNMDDFETNEEVMDNFMELVKSGDVILWQPFENDLPEDVYSNVIDMRDGLISVFSPCHIEISEKPSLAIMIEGGLVQGVFSDNPLFFEGVDVLVYDYDTDGADADEMLDITYLDGEKKKAVGHIELISEAAINIRTTIGGLK